MEPTEKLIDTRAEFYRTGTSMFEILSHAKASQLNNDAEIEEIEEELGEMTQEIIGTPVYVFSNEALITTPSGLMGVGENTLKRGIKGVFLGFEPLIIEEDDSEVIDDPRLFADIYIGQKNFSTNYTSGSFEAFLKIPVDEITRMGSQQELYSLLKSPDDFQQDDEIVLESLRKIIDKTRELVKGRYFTADDTYQEIDPWDYCATAQEPSLSELRQMNVVGTAERGFIRQQDSDEEIYDIPVEEVNFSGYYLGVIGVKRPNKPLPKLHFVFESLDSTFYDYNPDKEPALLFVPVSDNVSLNIALPDELTD